MGSPYLVSSRGPSSQSELEIRWDYPVLAPATPASPASTSETVAAPARRALPFAQAMARIAGADRRPVLVLRECRSCSGTDDALMTRRADNEKTMLLSRWFHCVKLPPDVLDADHPFHALFEGEAPSHLFVAAWDGSGRADLNGQQSRSELWKIMEPRIAEEYASAHEPALEELVSILRALDQVDESVGSVRVKLDAVLEEDGPKSPKAAKLRKELDLLVAQRNELRERAARASALELEEPREGGSEGPSRGPG